MTLANSTTCPYVQVLNYVQDGYEKNVMMYKLIKLYMVLNDNIDTENNQSNTTYTTWNMLGIKRKLYMYIYISALNKSGLQLVKQDVNLLFMTCHLYVQILSSNHNTSLGRTSFINNVTSIWNAIKVSLLLSRLTHYRVINVCFVVLQTWHWFTI